MQRSWVHLQVCLRLSCILSDVDHSSISSSVANTTPRWTCSFLPIKRQYWWFSCPFLCRDKQYRQTCHLLLDKKHSRETVQGSGLCSVFKNTQSPTEASYTEAPTLRGALSQDWAVVNPFHNSHCCAVTARDDIAPCSSKPVSSNRKEKLALWCEKSQFTFNPFSY